MVNMDKLWHEFLAYTLSDALAYARYIQHGQPVNNFEHDKVTEYLLRDGDEQDMLAELEALGIDSDYVNEAFATRIEALGVDFFDDPMDDIVDADVNGDGDTDVLATDTDGNGTLDTAIIQGDTDSEEYEGIEAAEDMLNDEKTSTGKTKKELDFDSTISDIRQKNILSALLERRY